MLGSTGGVITKVGGTIVGGAITDGP